jgi:hypothetical protein
LIEFLDDTPLNDFTVFGADSYGEDADKKSWERFIEFLDDTPLNDFTVFGADSYGEDADKKSWERLINPNMMS